MGMFSDWLDNLAMRQFGNDAGGRLAFFPYGWRRPGYYVEAGDQSKIAALAKIYFIANALTSAVGSSATLAFTQALLFDEHGPLRRKLELGFTVYAIAGLFLYILPALFLWKVYRGPLAGICSSLTTVGPDTIQKMQACPSHLRARALLVWIGIFLLMLGLLVAFAVSYRH